VRRILRRPAANRDVVEAYRYYARKAGYRTADRFIARVESTFKRLAAIPNLGAIYNPDEPAYPDLRYMPISRFRAYVTFYKPLADGDGIEVYRVLHGARDLEGILNAEFE
jgi:toxin ParE1/3/4